MSLDVLRLLYPHMSLLSSYYKEEAEQSNSIDGILFFVVKNYGYWVKYFIDELIKVTI